MKGYEGKKANKLFVWFQIKKILFLFFIFYFYLFCLVVCPHNVSPSFNFISFIHRECCWYPTIIIKIKQSKGNVSEKLTKRRCQTIYPDRNDNTLFSKIEKKLGSLNKTETFLTLCKYDFSLARSIAEEAASLFHCSNENPKVIGKDNA